MRKQKIVLIFLLLISSVLCSSLAFAEDDKYMPADSLPNIGAKDIQTTGSVHPSVTGDVKFNIDDFKIPKEMYVYLENQEELLSDEKMREICTNFGIVVAKRTTDLPDRKSYVGNGYKIDFWLESSINYRFEDNTVKPINKGARFPVDEELKKKAIAYLKDKELWHDNLEFVMVKGLYQKTVIFKYNKFGDKFYILRNVSVQLASVRPITNPHNIKVKAVSYKLKKAPAYKLIKTITTKEAIERIYAGNGLSFSPPSAALFDGAIIDKCKIIYESSNWIDPEDKSGTLSPVYRFSGANHRNNITKYYSVDVSAVDDYYLK